MYNPSRAAHVLSGRPARLLLATLVLAGCAGSPARPVQPQGVATDAANTPVAIAVAPQPAAVQADGGGISTDEPVLAPAPSAAGMEATPVLASAGPTMTPRAASGPAT